MPLYATQRYISSTTPASAFGGINDFKFGFIFVATVVCADHSPFFVLVTACLWLSTLAVILGGTHLVEFGVLLEGYDLYI